MSRQLIESIIDKDYITAESHFHDRLNAIMEKKLYEQKRMIAAMNEVVKPDPNRPGQFIGSNTKADWAKYRKQNKLPKTKTVEPAAAEFGSGKRLSKGDVERRRKAGYVQAHPALKGLEFIRKVRKYKETGKLDESDLPSTYVGREYEKELKGIEKAGRPADMSSVKTHVKKSEAEKVPKDDSTTSGMKRTLRQKYRKTTGVTPSGLALKSLSKAVASGTSLGGRFRAVKRAGKAVGTIKLGRGTIGSAVMGGLKGAASGLQNME